MENKIFYFDLETTGVNFWQHGIHQISGCIEVNGDVKEFFNFKVKPNPKAKIENEALEICGVTLDQINEYPDMEDVYNNLISILGKYVDKFNKKDKMYLCGYNNASFDNNFLRAFFVQNNDKYFGSWFWSNPIDVFILATIKLMDKRFDMVDFKLKTVASTLGINVDEGKLHDAEYDINLTRQIYYACK
jgi:DNA polymerase-3 subunit epsilon